MTEPLWTHARILEELGKIDQFPELPYRGAFMLAKRIVDDYESKRMDADYSAFQNILLLLHDIKARLVLANLTQTPAPTPIPNDIVADIDFLCYNGLEHPAAVRVTRWLQKQTTSNNTGKEMEYGT